MLWKDRAFFSKLYMKYCRGRHYYWEAYGKFGSGSLKVQRGQEHKTETGGVEGEDIKELAGDEAKGKQKAIAIDTKR